MASSAFAISGVMMIILEPSSNAMSIGISATRFGIQSAAPCLLNCASLNSAILSLIIWRVTVAGVILDNLAGSKLPDNKSLNTCFLIGVSPVRSSGSVKKSLIKAFRSNLLRTGNLVVPPSSSLKE